MPNDTLLFNQEDVKRHTPMSQNMSPGWFANTLLYVQEISAYPVLGDDLVDELQGQIENNTVTIENATLLSRLSKPLSYFTLEKSLPFINSQIHDNGVRKALSDKSESASGGEVTALQMESRNRAEHYMKQFIKWLNDNKANYPLYETHCRGNQTSGGPQMLIAGKTSNWRRR